MRFRKLRIAWSLVWGAAAVLLCVLWVRSYWVWDLWDNGIRPPTGGFSSIRGGFGGHVASDHTRRSSISDLQHFSTPVQPNQRTNRWWPRYSRDTNLTEVSIPYWMPVVIASAIAGAPWLSWRFSLRALFIAITAGAVVLGLIVYSVVQQ